MTEQHDARPQENDAGTTIGLSERARHTLTLVTDADSGGDGLPLFSTDTEAIQMACLLGIRVNDREAPPMETGRAANARTVINVGSLDEAFVETVKLLAPRALEQDRLTRVVRAYAEWGLAQIKTWFDEEDGQLSVSDLVERSEAAIEAAGAAEGDV